MIIMNEYMSYDWRKIGVLCKNYIGYTLNLWRFITKAGPILKKIMIPLKILPIIYNIYDPKYISFSKKYALIPQTPPKNSCFLTYEINSMGVSPKKKKLFPSLFVCCVNKSIWEQHMSHLKWLRFFFLPAFMNEYGKGLVCPFIFSI